MVGDDLSSLKDRLEVPWDDVREQRVLARVLVERRRSTPARRWRVAVVPVVAVAAGVAVALFVPWRPLQEKSPAPSASASTSPQAEQIMGLGDGSRAILVEDAGIRIEEQRADSVRIEQQRGTVRYDVRPDPRREFTVRVANSTIRVRGTAFMIAMSVDAVEVSVTQGRAEVDEGTRTRELSTGESLRVPIRSRAPATSAVEGSSEDAKVMEDSHERSTSEQGTRALPPTVTELQARADSARVDGRLEEAAGALEALVATYPRDPRVPGALFSLGRVEHARHRETAAARAFERCVRASPSGPLAEDALAEAAVSWSLAGNAVAARRHATDYLARHPNGVQTARMKGILGQ
jgi:transmembrane sensor